MKALLKDALFLGTMLVMLWICGCSTVAGIGNDMADACNGYSIQAGHRAAVQQAYQDGRNGIEYGK